MLLLSLCVIKGKNTKSEQLINKCYQPTFFVSTPQWVTGCEKSFDTLTGLTILTNTGQSVVFLYMMVMENSKAAKA